MSQEPPPEGEPERFEPDALAALPDELALSRLPAGRHGLPRSFVERNQRLRLIGAMLRVLPGHGYPRTTIGHVTREAGVSRSAFYAQFDGKGECFLATYDLAAGWLCERVEAAVAAEQEWGTGVLAGVSEALRLLAANPAVAHLIAVESLQAGPAARRRRQACVTQIAVALRTGRPGDPELSVDLEELLVGGALAHVAGYVNTGRTERLAEATPELVQYLLIPYLDPAETRRIADEAA
jgi:AcrR family transcriptional regulator